MVYHRQVFGRNDLWLRCLQSASAAKIQHHLSMCPLHFRYRQLPQHLHHPFNQLAPPSRHSLLYLSNCMHLEASAILSRIGTTITLIQVSVVYTTRSTIETIMCDFSIAVMDTAVDSVYSSRSKDRLSSSQEKAYIIVHGFEGVSADCMW